MALTWSSEDDERLKQSMAECQGMSWQFLADRAWPDKSRSPEQCIERWKELNKPSLIKGPWSVEEDRELISLVAELSTNKWNDVARRIGTRSGKQCRERWHNHLDPGINKTPFSREEDELILRIYNEKGAKWAEMSRYLKGRPDNAIKNHFNTVLLRSRHVVRARRASVSSTATTSTSRSSGSPGPTGTAGRRRLTGSSVSEVQSPPSPRFAPYVRPRSGTDAALLPSPGISTSAKPSSDFTSASTVLTRSQSSVDIPMRRRSVRTSLQMTPARSMDAPLHLSFSEVNLQRSGFYASGPTSAPMPMYASPPLSKGPDPFDTWSTPPATPDALNSASRDFYFSGGRARSQVVSPTSSTLQAALDDLMLSPNSTSTARTASMMTRMQTSLPPSPQTSPGLARSMSYHDSPLTRSGVPMSALAMYNQGLSGPGNLTLTPGLYRASLPSPSLMTDYGSSSSGHSEMSQMLPLTPPRSTPSSCSASSNSLGSYPFDHGDMPGLHKASAMAPFPAPASRQSVPAHHGAAHSHQHHYGLRSSTRDTPSPAKSDQTA